MPSQTKRTRLAAAVVGSSIALAACGSGDDDTASAGAGASGAPKLSGTIQIDGSSTVAPLSEAAAEGFQEEQPGVNVAVGTSGTGGGFKKFCAGETDISDASRPIKKEEAATCEAAGIKFQEITVANDGLAVVVNPDNPLKCITIAQLKKIWEPGSKVANLKEVDPSFPDLPLKLFGAGTDSGTFDYFTEAVNGKEKAIRTDYQPSEDDNVTVQGVQGNKGGLGFFGLSYVEENKGKVKALAVDGGAGCVEPSEKTVLDKTYKPLGRPLFIYATDKLVKRPEGLAFLEYYIENDEKIAKQALFVPLSEAQSAEAKKKVESLKG